MNLWLSLNKALTLFPNKVAVIDGSTTLTYFQLGQRIAGLATHLLSLGLHAGDVVAIAAPNCHEYLETYYACGITGITLCPLNYRLAGKEIAAILQDAGARILLIHTDFSEQLATICGSCPNIEQLILIGEGPRRPSSLPARDYEACLETYPPTFFDKVSYFPADHLAQLYYTSGTTGKPKGVMLSQGNVSFNALAIIAELGLNDSDVWLHAAPLFHLADAWATFAITWVGGRHIFIPYFNACQALESIGKHGVTVTILVPTMLTAMLSLHESGTKSYDCSSWRLALTGGSPIAPDTVRRAIAAFDFEYVQIYGMTETSPFLTLSKPTTENLLLSAEEQLLLRSKTGRPYIGAEVKVVAANGQEVEHNDSAVGEIIARGPTVFAGYWNQPAVTEQTLKDGWIYTGDLATVDAHGFINIVDRAKDMIITGGENVYSTEVEYALCEHPAILECAVFGIPDEYWGESVKAVVVRRPGQTIEQAELTEFLRKQLANYKIPRSIDFLEELPKTGSGKIYKKALKDHYWTDPGKRVH